MKSLALVPVIFAFLLQGVFAQSNFSLEAYSQFLNDNQNLTYQNLQDRFPLNQYYHFSPEQFKPEHYRYLDSIVAKYQLTESERALLKRNHFVVSERLRFNSFVNAFHDVYIKDLPVFVSTDAVLQALHASYDQVLSDIELKILKPKLKQLLDQMYQSIPLLLQKYEADTALHKALSDVDLYTTIARSLFYQQLLDGHLADANQLQSVWQAIQNEQSTKLPLFSDRARAVDFSQFTVRGHYTRGGLPEYFKTMMWLGRIDFFLTLPPENPFEPPWSREEIRRMNLAAFLLDELLDLSDGRALLKEMDQIITFMVGKSDNFTPDDFKQVKETLGLTDARQLLNDSTYDAYQKELRSTTEAQTKILSQILMMDPFNPEPGELPISFLLFGQRFIIDSYIFANVVFDRIVYQNKKIWRPLPDPLDAMFVLGNNDALFLLKEELETYHYASQLNALRYLVEAYDESFWEMSLYNVWLSAIRTLNPQPGVTAAADFLQSGAWRLAKLNTQLASWAQLRHDNLLYAKQSYTGITGCSFPYTFIEPNPEFFARITQFAQKAHNYFVQFSSPEGDYLIDKICNYFKQLAETSQRLEVLAQKELSNQTFTADEIDWLRRMIFQSGMSGEPPYDGWYARMYYIPDDAPKDDFVIADVHTQPADRFGTPVGHVLHVATGEINLGVFLAKAPYEGQPAVAFVGPMMSYYQLLTDNFKRLTDEEWAQMISKGDLPEHPDWVNTYLADRNGQENPAGRELPTQLYTALESQTPVVPKRFALYQNWPNPFNPTTTIRYFLAHGTQVDLAIYNLAGKKICTLVNQWQPKGNHQIAFNAQNLPSGLYLARLRAAGQQFTIKMVLIR